MTYTINQLAKLAGVSVRTLHYYDKIGLFKPAFIKENGYRYYAEKELVILQQILFFRELEFPLEKIITIIHSPSFDSTVLLLEQKKLLELKQKRVKKLLETITKTIQSLKGGDSMSNDDKYAVFNDPTYKKYKDEVEERWGNTQVYKESMEKVGKMSKAQLAQVKKDGEVIAAATAALMSEGFSHDSKQVQEQVELFYKHLGNFYTPSYELFKGLGQMYVDDPRFTKVYEKRAKGFAVFMRDAMAFYADANAGLR